jgi:hypothetical protein
MKPPIRANLVQTMHNRVLTRQLLTLTHRCLTRCLTTVLAYMTSLTLPSHSAHNLPFLKYPVAHKPQYRPACGIQCLPRRLMQDARGACAPAYRVPHPVYKSVIRPPRHLSKDGGLQIWTDFASWAQIQTINWRCGHATKQRDRTSPWFQYPGSGHIRKPPGQIAPCPRSARLQLNACGGSLRPAFRPFQGSINANGYYERTIPSDRVCTPCRSRTSRSGDTAPSSCSTGCKRDAERKSDVEARC